MWTYGCTSTTIGAVTGALLAQPERADDAANPLRHVFFGKVGHQGMRLLRRFDTRGIGCYGSTEVGFPIVNRAIDDDSQDVAGWLRPGYDARVVDQEGADVSAGQVGELWIRPPDRRMILREYLNHPRRTAEAVVDGWYHTGDAVRQLDHGGFVFVDRMHDTIRRFGENISSAALESVVVGDPGVLECAAVGVPSSMAGQEILLVVVPTADADRDPAALSSRLRDVLPRHMNPAYIAMTEELPKTPNGKIRKIDLAARFDLDTVWRARR